MSNEKKTEFQSSDWRQRPLNKEKIEYAAADAHFLPYLMTTFLDQLSQDQQAKMREETNSICMKQYKLARANHEDCEKSFLKNSKEPPENQAFYIFQELYNLRDSIA